MREEKTGRPPTYGGLPFLRKLILQMRAGGWMNPEMPDGLFVGFDFHVFFDFDQN